MSSSPLVLPAHSLLQTIRRFPLVVIAALATTTLCIACVHRGTSDHTYYLLQKLAMVTALGLPLFFALHCYREKKQLSVIVSLLVFVMGFLWLASFYFLFHISNRWPAADMLQFFMWTAALHLLVAFLPFSSFEEINGFWQYNKQLFLRFLLAFLYSSVLFAGIAGAIAAVRAIFDLNFSEKIYLDIWFVIAGLFNTVFFCAGVAEPIASLNEERSYPKGLKIFTQYVLIPLVVLYLLILYAYFIKILLGRSTFNDSIIAPVLFFSVAGILTGLLVHPIRNDDGNRCIKLYSHLYYFSLVPLIGFYYTTLGRTLLAMPVTPNRYLGVILGVWLGLVTLYFIFSHRKNIILIPLSLFIFLMAGSFGPWGMKAISRQSQVKHFTALMVKIGALQNNTLVKHEPGVTIEVGNDLVQIRAALEYIDANYGTPPFNRWLTDSCKEELRTSSEDYSYYMRREILEDCIGLNVYHDTNSTVSTTPYHAETSHNITCYRKKEPITAGLVITGYDELYEIKTAQNREYGEAKPVFLHDNVATFYTGKQVMFNVDVDSFVHGQLHLLVDSQHVDKHLYYSTNEMTVQKTNAKGDRLKMIFDKVRLNARRGKYEVEQIEGTVLIKYKNPRE